MLALVLIVGVVAAFVAPEQSKRVGSAVLRVTGRGVRWGARHGGRGVGSAAKATARWSKPHVTGLAARAWSGTRSALGRGLQFIADTSRTSGNPSKPKPDKTRLDRLAGWLRGPAEQPAAPEQTSAPVKAAPKTTKPSLVKTPKPEPKGTHVMTDVTRSILAAFDQLADLEVDSIAELEVICGDLSIMWAKIGVSYEQFLNNQEAAGVAPRPLRRAYNSLDGLDSLSSGARDTRSDLRNYYEAYFDQLESGKPTKVGLLDPAKGRDAA